MIAEATLMEDRPQDVNPRRHLHVGIPHLGVCLVLSADVASLFSA